MPELPEVETVVRGLLLRLPRRRISRVILTRVDIVHGDPEPLPAVLPGRRIQRITRIGKQIWMHLDDGREMLVHLGMTGRLLVARDDDPIQPHTHLRVQFDRSRLEMRFVDPRRFGGIWLLSAGWAKRACSPGRRVPPTGVDALTVRLPEFRKLLCRRRQIKALLLDQQPLSGVGNIYCDESLHQAGVHPLTRACDLDAAAVGRLHRALRRTLARAVRAGGSSVSSYRNVDDAAGFFQLQHRVYNRRGKPCRTCRTPIVRMVVAGRGTFICPQCQRQV